MTKLLRTLNQKVSLQLNDFINFSKSDKSWVLYISIIPISFMCCSTTVHDFLFSETNIYSLLKITIDPKILQNLIDTRIINISTIFSISFIIIGFLINNLKKHQEDTHDIIFKRIKLFPTLYLSLTLIGCLVIISLMRNNLTYSTFTNMIVWGTFLIIIILFRIGKLFKKIFTQLKPKNVYTYFYDEIFNIAKKVKFKHKEDKNRQELNTMKSGLEEQLIKASKNGETENLKHILSIYEKMSKLDF